MRLTGKLLGPDGLLLFSLLINNSISYAVVTLSIKELRGLFFKNEWKSGASLEISLDKFGPMFTKYLLKNLEILVGLEWKGIN